MFSHFSILGQNGFLAVFGTSKGVSQDHFWGHFGYLLGQLLGWLWVPPGLTNKNKQQFVLFVNVREKNKTTCRCVCWTIFGGGLYLKQVSCINILLWGANSLKYTLWLCCQPRTALGEPSPGSGIPECLGKHPGTRQQRAEPSFIHTHIYIYSAPQHRYLNS